MPSIQERRVFCYMTDTLSQEEISILKYVDYNVYISRAKAFQLFSTTSDYSIDQLLKCDFLQPIPNESSCFSLTPAGQSFINNYKILEKKNEEEMQKKVAALSAQFTPEELCSAERVLLALGTLL